MQPFTKHEFVFSYHCQLIKCVLGNWVIVTSLASKNKLVLFGQRHGSEDICKREATNASKDGI